MNWFGNVIMPTLAGLFFVIAVLRFSRNAPFTCHDPHAKVMRGAPEFYRQKCVKSHSIGLSASHTGDVASSDCTGCGESARDSCGGSAEYLTQVIAAVAASRKGGFGLEVGAEDGTGHHTRQ